MREISRALLAVGLLVALFAALAFAPRTDPAKTVAGLPCSVVSENEAGAVLGTTVRLLPTTGTICRYVSTQNGPQRSLNVVARHDDDPATATGRHQLDRSLFVRYGRRAYVFTVNGSDLDPVAALAAERTLAGAVQRTVVAKTR